MTQNLIDLYKIVHNEKKDWGKSAHRHLLSIQACLAEIKPESIIEYGCGKSNLHEQLNYGKARYYRYDPAISGLDELTVQNTGLVINTDVLEHIPINILPEVLKKISELSTNVYFYICTRPAKLILPNGENAHCTIMSAEEWLKLISKYFTKAQLIHIDKEEGCVIITWESVLNKVIKALEECKIIQKKYDIASRPWYKKLKKRYKHK